MGTHAKIDTIPNQPGAYALLCTCGYDKRTVLASERFFTCERPVEPKVPACAVMHEFESLFREMEKRYREAEAKAFLAENDRKVAEAKAVLAASKPEAPVKTVTAPVVTELQGDVETKVLKPVSTKKIAKKEKS